MESYQKTKVYVSDPWYPGTNSYVWNMHYRKIQLADGNKKGKECNSQWKDKDGYGCEVYRKNKWCSANGGYGVNWNSWKFHSFKGKTALVCPQCGCTRNCDPKWQDAQCFTCDDYKKYKICTSNGGYGPGWTNLTFDDFSSDAGRTAEACPQCGCKESKLHDWSSALKLSGRWSESGWRIVSTHTLRSQVKKIGKTGVKYMAQTVNSLGDYGNASLNVSLFVNRASCLKYFWRLESEENYDFLSLYLNQVKRETFAGKSEKHSSWTERQVTLSKGKNDLSWEYKKDSGNSRGTDAAFVANIRLVTGSCLITDCLKSGWDYWPISYKKFKNIANAKACQVLCQRHSKCQVFTYLAKKDALGGRAKKNCYIIFAHNGLRSKKLKGAMSGPRICG